LGYLLCVAGSMGSTETAVCGIRTSDDNGEDGEPNHQDLSNVEGTLTAIDTTAGTISVQPQDGSAPLTLTVTDASRIEVDDADVTLSQLEAILSPGQRVPVSVEFDPTTNAVTKLEVREDLETEDQDTVQNLQPAGGGAALLTVRHGSGRRARTSTFTLLPGTVVLTATSIIRVRDLHAGDTLRVSAFVGRGHRRFAPIVRVTRARRGC
jgi:hypothetical protein